MLVRTLLALTPPALARRVEGLLDSRDVTVTRAGSPDDVWQVLQREDVDLLVSGSDTETASLEDWISSIRSLPDAPTLVMLTEREDATRRASYLAAGCLAVLNVRIPDRELRATLQALVRRLDQEASTRLAAERAGRVRSFAEIVARSSAMADVLAVARRVAGADSSLLLLGETGVGKERIARAVHGESARASGPFVPVNCGAIPEGLLESELFGHEQGAFTGAVRARRGHFEVAHRGTLFLDEVGELPLHLQVKLLRVLEDRQIQRVGSERRERVDVRIIAATNRDLEAEVEARRFRADLFFRLAVVTLHVPPLRERLDDIPELVAHYVDRFRRTLAKPVEGLAPDAMEAVLRHPWPGNVRELINVLERAVLLAQGPQVHLADLPRTISGLDRRPEASRRIPRGAAASFSPETLRQPLRQARRAVTEAFERAYLDRLLDETGGRVGTAAQKAGIHERSLFDLMRKHDVHKETFRPSPSRNRG
jgi:DNA-binding NtrC family response regulator